jgi:hypothetical protein
MKFGWQVMPQCDNLYSRSLNRFKVVEVQSCELDALPAPFSLAHQWDGIV